MPLPTPIPIPLPIPTKKPVKSIVFKRLEGDWFGKQNLTLLDNSSGLNNSIVLTTGSARTMSCKDICAAGFQKYKKRSFEN